MKKKKSGRPKKKIIGIIILIALLIVLIKYLLMAIAIVASAFVLYKFYRTKRKRWLLWLILSALLILTAAVLLSGNRSINTRETASTSINSTKSKSVKTKTVSSRPVNSRTEAASEISRQLMNDSNQKSSGTNKNYYWDNGPAQISGFDAMKAGDASFTADNQGRSGTARAILTYAEYKRSQGGRQGEPLNPPAWPADNPKIAINFALTGKIYHGYLYNRSHSIADSLLGDKSYSSKYNFTTGTRPQNVGANQKGGMRAAEELAENYWKDHPNSPTTIDYETRPIYNSNETVPRGSIVDEKSSDGVINEEIVVINDAEGISINYNSAAASQEVVSKPSLSAAVPSSSVANNHSYTTNGAWSTAAVGMVFVSDSGKYYSMVTNPNNYHYMSQDQANSAGYTQAERGNEYAKP